MNNRILLIEDDVSISELIQTQFAKEGFDISCAYDGEQALQAFSEDIFDIILLDLMLPKLDGIEILKIIRSQSMVPILIMSAKDGDLDKALGLGFGADDYISKPFSMIELTARVKANIRRALQYSNPVITTVTKEKIHVGELDLDTDNFAVYKSEDEIKLTAKEFQILKLFMTNPKKVFTKAQLYNLVWGEDYYGDNNVINVHMRRLREKIEDDPSTPRYIKTLWGIGYKLGEF
ncbi:response regulator transcription factor [Paenibacillus wulumuqiensis]|uniref:response regulator transcription factor n=1 Tax=Paenibacillus wulumuqiensis TaxID=1567107 RepID=UPI00061989A0|nr:response regulator transcription factor [Paenibacillus wulumuqiensis]